MYLFICILFSLFFPTADSHFSNCQDSPNYFHEQLLIQSSYNLIFAVGKKIGSFFNMMMHCQVLLIFDWYFLDLNFQLLFGAITLTIRGDMWNLINIRWIISKHLVLRQKHTVNIYPLKTHTHIYIYIYIHCIKT